MQPHKRKTKGWANTDRVGILFWLSVMASYDEIKENDFNLNIPRYVDTFEEEELIDIDKVKKNIADIETELAQTQMQRYLEELGL